MSRQLAHNISNTFNGKLSLLSPTQAARLEDELKLLASLTAEDEKNFQADARQDMMATYALGAYSPDKPFAYANGMAVIPITGMLINRYRYSWSSLTGYNAIREMLHAALDDSDVRGIVYDACSGGGQVAGCFELAAEIYAARSIKPSVAVIDSYAFSACYALVSAAGRIVATPSAEVGSIGALITHFDYSKMMDEYGVKVSFIHSGAHKVDGNPYEKLSREDINAMQATVDEKRKEFVALVAMHRGLDIQAVYDTEAACYSAEEALTLGLVDAILPPVEAVSAFYNELSGSQTNQEIFMSTNKPETQGQGAAAQNEATQTAPATEPTATVDTAAVTAQAVTAERQRINGILTCAEATNRSALANHLALNTQMTVDEAKGALAASPEAVPQAAAAAAADTNLLDAAMSATGGGAGLKAEEAASTEPTAKSRAQEILAAHATATGAAV